MGIKSRKRQSGRYVGFWMPERIFVALKVKTVEKKTTMSDVIRTALETYLGDK